MSSDVEMMDIDDVDIIDIPVLPEEIEKLNKAKLRKKEERRKEKAASRKKVSKKVRPKVASNVQVAEESDVSKDARIQRFEQLLQSLEDATQERKSWTVESIMMYGAGKLTDSEIENVFEPTTVTITRESDQSVKVDFPDALYALDSLVRCTEPCLVVHSKATAPEPAENLRIIARNRIPFSMSLGRFRLFSEEYTPIATEFLFCRFVKPDDLQKVTFIQPTGNEERKISIMPESSKRTLKSLQLSIHTKRYNPSFSGLYSESSGASPPRKQSSRFDLRNKLIKRRKEQVIDPSGSKAKLKPAFQNRDLDVLESDELGLSTVPDINLSDLIASGNDLRSQISVKRALGTAQKMMEMQKEAARKEQLAVYDEFKTAYLNRPKAESYDDLDLFE